MAAQMTPLPWRTFPSDLATVYSADGTVLIVQIGDSLLCSDDEDVPTQAEAESNAAFIVRACNAHYPMLEALKAAVADIEAGGNLSAPMIRAAIAAAEAEGR